MALAGVLPGALRSAAAVDGAAALLAAVRPTPPLRPHLAAAACAGRTVTTGFKRRIRAMPPPRRLHLAAAASAPGAGRTVSTGFERRIRAAPPPLLLRLAAAAGTGKGRTATMPLYCKKEGAAFDSPAPSPQNTVEPVEAVSDPSAPPLGFGGWLRLFLKKYLNSGVLSICIFVGFLAFKEDKKATVVVTVCDKAHKVYNILSKIAPIALDLIGKFWT